MAGAGERQPAGRRIEDRHRGRDHAAATRAAATARGAATMPRKQGATIGLGIPLGAILLLLICLFVSSRIVHCHIIHQTPHVKKSHTREI